MKELILITIVLSLFSCTNRKNQSLKKVVKSANSFESYFANADTTKAGQSLACAGGIYKLLDNNYVIHFTCGLPVQFDSCYTIDIRELSRNASVELYVFDEDNANLTNRCTDIIIPNAPEPSRTLYAESGEFIVGYSNPTIVYGNQSQHTSILVKELVFVDTKTGKKIRIKNELLWKVLDLGTPG